MPAARVCECKHVASNHRITNIDSQFPPPNKLIIYHECLVDKCICKKFNHNKTVSAKGVNYE